MQILIFSVYLLVQKLNVIVVIDIFTILVDIFVIKKMKISTTN
jgi:hypothetical protein